VTTATPHDRAEARCAVTVHAHLTALPDLLAEAELAEAHAEARDQRTGALVAYSFATIHRALALHVAEAVRAGLARLRIEPSRDESARDAQETPETAMGAVGSTSSDDRPGQYL
jgi:hypothetical protein